MTVAISYFLEKWMMAYNNRAASRKVGVKPYFRVPKKGSVFKKGGKRDRGKREKVMGVRSPLQEIQTNMPGSLIRQPKLNLRMTPTAPRAMTGQSGCLKAARTTTTTGVVGRSDMVLGGSEMEMGSDIQMISREVQLEGGTLQIQPVHGGDGKGTGGEELGDEVDESF